jgi:CubicO group peptidase (beta-lactamase class C family)
LASLTKPLVVTTLCLLAFRSRDLALDTTVGEVLEEARGCALATATVRQLLDHTSGLPAWRPLYAITDSAERVLETILGLQLEAVPGQRVLYSCLDFILLGLMVQRVTGEPLDTLFERRVLAPLGLESQLGFAPRRDSRRLAGGARAATVERQMTRDQGLDPERVPLPTIEQPDDGNARFLGGVAGNAGLFGTAVGVWKLAGEYLPGQGSLLTEDEARAATVPSSCGNDDVRALGWQLASARGAASGPGLVPESYGHTGFTGTSVWLDPDRSAVLVLLANRHHPGHRGTDLHPLRRRYHALALREL